MPIINAQKSSIWAYVAVVVMQFVIYILIRWEEIILLQDKLRFISARFKKDVPYSNMRAIALSLGSKDYFILSVKLHKPFYSSVSDIRVPKASCSQLQILAREAPEAQWDDLAAQWRDGWRN